MNERIKQLAEQAGVLEDLVDNLKDEVLTYIARPQDIQKFAELIVSECAQIAKDTQDFYNEHNDGIINTEIWTMIKYQFGVDSK